MAVRKVLQVVGGFSFGALAGFAIGLASGKATRERIPGSVSTRYDDGKVQVEVDLARAIARPGVDLWDSLRQ